MFRSNCPLKPHLNPQSALSLSEQNQPCNGSSCVHNEQGLLSSFLAPAANQRPIGRARTFPTPRVSSSPAIIRCAEGGRERGAAAVESNAQTEVCHPRPITLASKPADLNSLQTFRPCQPKQKQSIVSCIPLQCHLQAYVLAISPSLPNHPPTFLLS